MKPRHAALALVGWYLMFPPLIKLRGGTFIPDETRPISEWTVHSSFDSADACASGEVSTRRWYKVKAHPYSRPGPQ